MFDAPCVSGAVGFHLFWKLNWEAQPA